MITEISHINAHGPLKWSIGKSGGWGPVGAYASPKFWGGRLCQPSVGGGRLNGPWALTSKISVLFCFPSQKSCDPTTHIDHLILPRYKLVCQMDWQFLE